MDDRRAIEDYEITKRDLSKVRIKILKIIPPEKRDLTRTNRSVLEKARYNIEGKK